MECNKAILILDKIDYKKKDDLYKKMLKKKYSQCEVVYTEYEDSLIRFVRKLPKIGKGVHHICYWIKSLKYALRVNKRASDCKIICINPLVGIFLGLLNSKKKFDLMMCGFLFEEKKNVFYYAVRKKIVLKALNGISTVVVYANQEVSYYNRLFGVKNKFQFVQYGIDYDANEAYKKKLPEDYLFSGGGSNRDYKTLFDAYSIVKKRIDIPLYIATLPYCVADLNIDGIKILDDVVLETFGSVMRRAKVIILSLKDTDISAGHQVMLQALNEGRPIIVNEIQAIKDYVNSSNVVFFKSGDALDLAQKIENVYNHLDAYDLKSKKNIELYQSRYKFENLLERLIYLEK